MQSKARPEPNGIRGTNLDKKSVSEGKRTRPKESDKDVGEGTSRQDSRANNAPPSSTTMRASPVQDEEEHEAEIVPVVDPLKSNNKKKKTKSRYSVSGFTFITEGEGTMENKNIGVINFGKNRTGS